MEHETAGDPMSGLKWTHRTTVKIVQELAEVDIVISPNTVAKILKNMGFSLRVNHKKISTTASPDRDTQFGYLAHLREEFTKRGAPILSVDTKKRELIGLFKNPGRSWQKEAIPVNDHDFRSDALGVAIPYGIYDIQANRGSVFLGVSHDTSQFAVASIEKWWRYEGQWRYRDTQEILIFADTGGSNGARVHLWKFELQTKLCDRHGLAVTVSHYPSGASKWNPIEHRLFSEISKNWAGVPLRSYETTLNYIRTTTTKSGLQVTAHLDEKHYPKGIKVTEEQMSQLELQRHDTLPKWNYTLRPR